MDEQDLRKDLKPHIYVPAWAIFIPVIIWIVCLGYIIYLTSWDI